ncbi:MAG: hypothetical protein JSW27_21895 [Phycisphaerales bacterium]|nr:MAG: hypothetical protein JSW27_21895 [Phycisphaerales bacterium]
MRRIAVVHAVLIVALMIALLAGCSSAPSAATGSRCPVTNEVTLAGYQTGAVASSFDSLGTEVTMPLWFVSGN